MKRLFVIVEGQTEKEFVENSLRKFLISNGIFDVRAIMIQTSKGNKGGFVNYDHLKNDIIKLLKSEKDILVSMFVDFFRIPTNFPNFEFSKSKSITDAKIEVMLDGISNDINDTRFIPYIQKHEFEALLFSSNEGFSNLFENEWIIDELKTIVNNYPNPEEINTGSETAPSKRIIKILEEKKYRYDKIAEGNLIAEEIGFEKILEKCPRFNQWIYYLIEKCKNS